MTVLSAAALLPAVDVLRARCRALAALDEALGDDDATYGFTAWGDDEAALMDNGSGDQWAIVFAPAGAFIRVFNHESPLTPYRNDDHQLWPGVVDGLPEEFAAQLDEPAFSDGEDNFLATAVLWRRTTDDRWPTGSAGDASDLLDILVGDPVERFVAYAEDYYETTVDRAAVTRAFADAR